MKIKLLCVIFPVLVSVIVTGQTAQQLKELGDDAFTTSNYHSAVKYYEACISMDPGNNSVLFNLAESHRHLFNYTAAAEIYTSLWKNSKREYPESGFWAGMMLKSQERYDSAAIMFRDFIESGYSGNTFINTERAKSELTACDSARIIISNPKNIEIRNFTEVNTPWSEFNPVALGDTAFVFSALRPMVETNNPLLSTGDYGTQIYMSTYGATGLRKPMLMPQNVNGRDVHTANITITEDGKRAYFNRCSYSNYKLRCDIWKSEFINNQWSKAIKLPEPLNNNTFTTTQPYVTIDSVSGGDLLYFSSDRPGGMGGLDLWFCIIRNSQPEMPVNLGSIVNTPGDEITPFYYSQTGTLYFSSSWHYGLGGYDVFTSHGAMSSWEKPLNAGSPVNTGANDFFFYIGNEDEAFLTSNRTGSMTFREQTCCNDIYLVSRFKTGQVVSEVFPDSTVFPLQQDILELLPLSLYFNNDHPDPGSKKPVTALSYDETWSDYIKQRQKFVREYSGGLDQKAKYFAEAEMEDFFDNYVYANYKKLEILADFLYQDLRSGSNVTLKVRGFTSPLTSAEYNIILAGRRISSLVNYFRNWNDGQLVPYMDFSADNQATFRIIEEPSGEALANPYVSDNPADRRKSVYSKAASLERRIEILIYESDFKKYINLDENIPVIHIADNLIQLNSMTGKSDVELEIPIHNPGKVSLKINSVEPSSSRISVISAPSIIEPGKTGIVKIKISGSIEQDFTQYVIIYSNSGDERSAVYFSTLVR